MYNQVCFLRSLARRILSLSNLYCFTYNKLQERVDNSARSLNLLTICHWSLVIGHLYFVRTYARCDRKPYSCVAVIHELPQMRVMFCVSPVCNKAMASN